MELLQELPGASDEPMPPILQNMLQDLTSRHVIMKVRKDLETAVKQASSPYSFLRERGLRQASSAISFAVENKAAPRLLDAALDVVHIQLMEAAMASMRRFVSKHGKQPEPLSILSLSAGEEEEALQLIQGLSLVHKRSRDLASSKEMMEALLLNLSSPHSTACSLLLLDTILILQIQSEEMQRCFFNLGGIGKVYECICSPSSPPELAAKGCEFLALLMHYALKGPEGAPKAATRQLESVLGKPAASRLMDLKIDLAEDAGRRLLEELQPLLKLPGKGGVIGQGITEFLTDVEWKLP